jgi:hypothetical protein
MAHHYPGLAEATQHQHVLYCAGYKLIVTADGTTRLYELQSDANEQRDLILAGEEVPPDCAREFERLTRSGNVYTPFGTRTSHEANEAELEELRALGYVE